MEETWSEQLVGFCNEAFPFVPKTLRSISELHGDIEIVGSGETHLRAKKALILM